MLAGFRMSDNLIRRCRTTRSKNTTCVGKLAPDIGGCRPTCMTQVQFTQHEILHVGDGNALILYSDEALGRIDLNTTEYADGIKSHGSK